jgi:hypothetical protein
VLDAHAEQAWPETLALDNTWSMVENRRTHRQTLAFHVLGAYGYPADAKRGRVWALHASHQAQQADWEAFLRSLDVTAPPKLVVTDGSAAPSIASTPLTCGYAGAEPRTDRYRSTRGSARRSPGPHPKQRAGRQERPQRHQATPDLGPAPGCQGNHQNHTGRQHHEERGHGYPSGRALWAMHAGMFVHVCAGQQPDEDVRWPDSSHRNQRGAPGVPSPR